jgi:PadR family transcriptional regulator, regulatory protein AphA
MHEQQDLPESAYVVLGLLEMLGPSTPYDLKKMVDQSIGYFWDFPRAQLYVEPERLARLGLVREEREQEGRRRRVYHLTDAGRATQGRWLRESPPEEVQLRDAGLLKLFFGFMLSGEEVSAMARREADLHRRRLADYERIAAELRVSPKDAFALATLRMGLEYERLSIAYWEGIAAHPPTTRSASSS